jgi:hypothetical protein
MRPSRLVLLLFLAAQVCDGLFTYMAVSAFGLAAEGNLLLATWIALVGPAPALLGAKLLAAGCGVLLYVQGVHRALAVLTAIYAFGAVGPWMLVLGFI